MGLVSETSILIAAFACALALCLFSIPNIIYVTKKKRLFDVPDNNRKVHRRIIPNLGGVGLFFAFMMVSSLFINNAHSQVWNYIATSCLLLFITGLKDDLVGVSPGKKFVAQIAAAFIAAHYGQLQLNNLHGLLGIYELPSFISLPFTVIGITFITNALNLIDGIDGLAGSVSLLASLLFGLLLFWEGNTGMAIMAFSLAGAISGFLYYNIAPARIFMGDTGSLLLGFILALLGIALVGSYRPGTELAFLIGNAPATLLITIAILFIPVVDTFRVFAMRIIKGKSPFSADRTHLHHYLLDCGYSHTKCWMILLSANLIIICAAFLLQNLNLNISIPVLILIGMSMVGLLIYLRNRKLQSVSSTLANMADKSKGIKAGRDVHRSTGAHKDVVLSN